MRRLTDGARIPNGAPAPRRPTASGARILFGVVWGVAMLLMAAVVYRFCVDQGAPGPRRTESASGSPPALSTSSAPVGGGGPRDVSLATLFLAYGNEVAADAAYKGKTLLVRGEVLNVSRDPFENRTYVHLGESAATLRCYFDNDSALLSVRDGAPLTVTGVCGGMGDAGEIVLKHCGVPPSPKYDEDVQHRGKRIGMAVALFGVWAAGGRDAWLKKLHGGGFDWTVDPPAIGSTWYDMKDRPQKVVEIRRDRRGFDLVVTDVADAGTPGIPAPIFVRMATQTPDPEAKALALKLAPAASSAIVATVPRDE